MHAIPFLWTNDDIGVGQAPQLRRQLAFLDEFGVRATFFVIPMRQGRALADDPELIEMMTEAREQGHEFHQHGTRHDPFECGVPETWMLDFSPDVRRRYDEQRLDIEKQHSFEAMVRTIDEGRRLWREAFGDDSPGFRPGWGAFTGTLYRALDALGYRWVSSRIVGLTSWLWNQGRWDVSMGLRECLAWAPHIVPGTSLWEIPMTGGDYAFSVPNVPERIGAMVELAVREFDFCREHGVPFVMVSHWHGLERNDASGYEVHRRLLSRIRESGKAEFCTVSQLALEDVGEQRSGADC